MTHSFVSINKSSQLNINPLIRRYLLSSSSTFIGKPLLEKIASFRGLSALDNNYGEGSLGGRVGSGHFSAHGLGLGSGLGQGLGQGLGLGQGMGLSHTSLRQLSDQSPAIGRILEMLIPTPTTITRRGGGGNERGGKERQPTTTVNINQFLSSISPLQYHHSFSVFTTHSVTLSHPLFSPLPLLNSLNAFSFPCYSFSSPRNFYFHPCLLLSFLSSFFFINPFSFHSNSFSPPSPFYPCLLSAYYIPSHPLFSPLSLSFCLFSAYCIPSHSLVIPSPPPPLTFFTPLSFCLFAAYSARSLRRSGTNPPTLYYPPENHHERVCHEST